MLAPQSLARADKAYNYKFGVTVTMTLTIKINEHHINYKTDI